MIQVTHCLGFGDLYDPIREQSTSGISGLMRARGDDGETRMLAGEYLALSVAMVPFTSSFPV